MYSRYKDKEKRKLYLKNWRLKNRKKINKYLVRYLKENNKRYYKKRTGKSLTKIHKIIEKKLGKPRFCEICKRTDKKIYQWSNKNHKYSLNIKFWQRLCVSCHCEFDRKFNNKKTYLEK